MKTDIVLAVLISALLPGVAAASAEKIKPPAARGPAAALPSWLPEVGNRATVSLNKLPDVDPCPQRPCSFSAVSGQAGLFAWSGMIFAEHLGELGSIVFTGGGHSDYAGNEVYRYDVATRLWSRITDPHNIVFIDPKLNVGSLDGEHWADNTFTTTIQSQPVSAHFYGNVVYLPPGVGGAGANGALLTINRHATAMAALSGNRSHILDLANPAWKRFIPETSPRERGSTVFSAANNKIYFSHLEDGVHMASFLHFFDLSAMKWGRLNLSRRFALESGNLSYIQSRNLLIHYMPGRKLPLGVIDADTGAVHTPEETGDVPAALPDGHLFGGGEWVEEWQQFVYYIGGGDKFVYRLSMPRNPTADPWIWAREEIGGASPEGTRRNMPHYSRFRWVPALKAFVWLGDANGNVQIWRLAPPPGASVPKGASQRRP